MKGPLLALGLALFTLACVPGLKPAPVGEQDATPALSAGALATEEITAEPLTAPAPLTPAADAAADPAANPSVVPKGGLASLPPKARPEGLIDPAAAEASAQPELSPAPKPPASPEEVACLRKGGLWMRAGKSIAMTCVKMTRDAGKQCHREQDCQGQCLARSMTCAPYDPLFGCNEVLQNDGARVTLCID